MEIRERRSERLKREKEAASTERAKTGTETRKGHVINCELLNVRVEASRQSRVLGTLKNGDIVALTENVNGFYKIVYGAEEAYVASEFISIKEV